MLECCAMRQKMLMRLGPAGLLGLLAGAAYLLPLVAHAIVSQNTRYMADDFCMAATSRLGVIQAETFWHFNWSGRFASNLLATIATIIGPGVAPVLPAVLMVAWITTVTWSLAQVRPWLAHSWPVTGALGIGLVSATLNATPNPVQSLYWQTGSLVYTAPLVVGSLLPGVLLRQSPLSRPAGWLLVLVLAFFAGGFSEVYTGLQLALLGLGLAAMFALAWRRRGGWPAIGPWLAGCIGSMLALAIIGLAPGTRVRQGTFAPPPGLYPLLANSRLYTFWFLRDAFLQHAPILMAVITLFAGAAALAAQHARLPRLPGRWLASGLLTIPVVAFGLIYVCYVPVFYALQYLPPDRVLIINWYVLILATAAWGFVAGLSVAPRLVVVLRWPTLARIALGVVLVTLLAIPPILAALDIARTWPAARGFASTWDSDEAMLRAARANGGGTVTLARLDTPGHIDNLSEDPSFWTNQCVAQYFGVQVRAIAPPPSPSSSELTQRTPINAEIGGIAQVLGYNLASASVRPGQALTVTVYWKPINNTDKPYTVFVHLYDPATGVLGQFDGYPGQGQYPTTIWIRGQTFADIYQVPVHLGLPATSAVLELGLYDLDTLQRLPVSRPDGGTAARDSVQLTQVQVTP